MAASKRRDWTAAREKVTTEARCRVCGERANLQAAHTVGRKYDGPVVDPLDIVPLCPECHREYDAGGLDLLPCLNHAEQGRAVSHVGLEAARLRLAPSTRPVARARSTNVGFFQ